MRRLPALVLAPLLLLLAGCVTHEPRNLEAAKIAVRHYHDSGDYDRELAGVAARAQAWIETRAAHGAVGEKLAVVLDIDETALSNWPYMKAHDFGWDDASWNAWIAAGECPAVAPVRAVFLAARRADVEVFFITGREQPRDRSGTEKNLREAGLGDYAMLIMAPPGGAKPDAATFKTAARAALEREGRTIIANIGDQRSDLTGGHAERVFKLPDPFYLTE
jgi:acid phosphatase